MYDYGEYCPVSKAVQLLCERWTLLIVREMLAGVTRFNEFRRYLPRLSPTLLQTRLRALETAGVILRRRIPEQQGYEYQLTPAGRELEAVVLALGQWGSRWVESRLSEQELSIDVLMRDIQLTCDVTRLPRGRTVVLFQLTDVEAGNKWYLVAENGITEVCDESRLLDVDVYVTATRRTLVEIWLGDLPYETALAAGRLRLHGNPALVQAFPAWFGRSPFLRREAAAH